MHVCTPSSLADPCLKWVEKLKKMKKEKVICAFEIMYTFEKILAM
jgi:hypothetical protein